MFDSFDKLKKSLSKTKSRLMGQISQVIRHRKIDDDLLDEIEEILIEADVGTAATMRLIESVKQKAKERKLTDGEDVLILLKEEISVILARDESVLFKGDDPKPAVWLIVGVNGVGKTTTIGKLAAQFSREGKKVIIAACDTFRAGAIDQITIWAERSKIDIIRAEDKADPASVAYDAARAAVARSADLLLIDTAGRLHTKTNLMEELKKIRRVVNKAIPNAQIYSKLIIDGSTGQNAISQVKVFTEAVGCDGIIVTKLDGTAKGGVMIAVAEELGVSVDFIGLGEGIDDLQRFDATQFAEALCSDG
ncbi:MAG: signal recognition particle-docking protein FtsY [candidate division Zixibacteria bacterium]|nr:signal recognition particle-docking protein FtsY [candidate division Zixibacteria bacterium]